MLASKILDTVTDLYHDKGYDRIDESTYLNYITDALQFLLVVRPDANSKGSVYTTVSGLEQPLPDDGFRLIDVAYNFDGSEQPTIPITRVDRSTLDNAHPLWMSDTDTVAYNYIYDPVVPKEFILYPVIPEGSKIKIYYSKAFPAVTSSDQEIALDEIFFTPVVDAVMYFLYRMDVEGSEYAVDKANLHATSFNSALNLEQGSGLAISPKEGK